ncbi:MAG: glycyl-radical enzyme activating protein [Eubacteriales bacterium]|nr:glycyl-radical enzyme activating protein [Eubacteriales bacterium]
MMNTYQTQREQIKDGRLAVVTDIQRFTVHDGPGIRTMVFFKGCPLRCRWCQNPETWRQAPELMYFKDNCIGCGNCIRTCKNGALSVGEAGISIDVTKCKRCGQCAEACYPGALKVSGALMSVDEVFDIAIRDQVFYEKSGGGVTLSGGECTTYAPFASELLRRLQVAGIHTAIETCGFCAPERFTQVTDHVNLVLFDIKVPDDRASVPQTGQQFQPILCNLESLRRKGTRVILRYPMIPGVNTGDAMLETIARIAADNSIEDIHILPFHQMGSNKWSALYRDYSCETMEPPTDEAIQKAKEYWERSGLRVNVGGTGA